ncbi:MAG TPA: carbonic anhydrase [Planctomycetota bacterium]|nr:carbonic anhydrase [Planctomycetota bacterium]
MPSAPDSVILGVLRGMGPPAVNLGVPRRPSAALLTCVDERVVPEAIFGCAPGGLYSVRLAGHVVTPEVVSSLEIAVGLGCRLVIVLGHTDCSAVRLEREHTGDHFAIVQRIRWATRGLPWRASLDEAIEANVRASVAELRDRLRVRIVGGVYDLATGQVRSLE